MRLTPRLALAPLALVPAGCSADQDPGLRPADPDPSPTSSTQAQPDPAPTGDPLTFGSSGSSVTIRCFPRGERRMVVFDGLRTDRAVSLTGLRADGDALRISDSYVRRLGRRDVAESGIVDLRRGRSLADRPRWSDAEPLEGARLEPGSRYTFFAVGRVVPDARLGDLGIGWADEQASDTSRYDLAGRTRSGGC